jgi:sterol desaturase/sphingolipid hydroxylase (fatty acid hydroxylase superfamily)
MRASKIVGRLVSWSLYPALVVGGVVGALGALDRGAAPGLAVTAAFLATLAITTIAERVRPRDATWNPTVRGMASDGVYLLLAALVQRVAGLVAQVLAVTAGVATARWLRDRGWPHVDQAWGLAVAALALSDLGKYVLHRLAHEHRWLWRFHAAHHAPARMYSLNGVRLHPVNMLWNLVLDAAVPAMLGLDGRAIVAIGALRGVVSVLQHANVATRLGPLNWIFSTPELHQWHHSARLDEGNANYGSTLIVWDALFGTRILPHDRRAPDALGLSASEVQPRAVRHQLVWPWCERRAATCRALRGWQPEGRA